MHGWDWLERFAQDGRYALRQMVKTPAFTVTAVLVLAIGIGANTAIFTFVSGVILRPLGYPHPEQLMWLTTEFPALKFAKYGLSPPEYFELREVMQSFASVGAFTADEVNLIAGDRPLRVRSVAVDEPLLGALGLRAAHGRLFANGETNSAGGQTRAVVIVSHELWRSAFGEQPLVGRMVEIEGRPHEVVGIMPPGADVMDHRVEVWLPLGLDPANRQNRASHYLDVVGRLKGDVTPGQAQSELGSLVGRWAERFGIAGGHVPTNRPTVAADHIIVMTPVQEAILGNAGRAIWVLQAAVGLVLLIACANLASLFVARAETRRREYAVRAALGASRARLLRQAITEGVALSIAGGVLGVWLARVGVQALARAYPTSLPRTNEVAIDAPVLMFALAVSIGTGVVFGLIPVAHRRWSALVTALKEGGDRGGGAARHHLRRALVIAEVALAVMLVMGAGLLVRTVRNLTAVDAGFDRSRLVTFSMTLPPATSQPLERTQAFQRVLAKLRATPGVQRATAMTGLPPNRAPNGRGTVIENHTAATGEPFEIVDYYQFVMSDYVETLGIPIVAGRGFQSSDAESPGKVVIINETMANAFWEGRSPLGQRLQPATRKPGPWYTVIGVAKDVKQGGVDQKTGSELYMLVEQQAGAQPTMNVVMRTTLPVTSLSRTVESIVREVDRTVPVVRLRDMDDVFAESIRRPRLLAQLLGAFASLALLLAAVGTYGVLAYVVTERRREIGIRMALGAARSTVLAQVMGEGLRLTALGVAAGLLGAFALNRFMSSLLFGVAPTDLVTLGAVILTIVIVAMVASGLPAWRASRLDPSIVLRDG